jgi:hypothetical protein
MADYDWFEYTGPTEEEIYASKNGYTIRGGKFGATKEIVCNVCACMIAASLWGMTHHRGKCEFESTHPTTCKACNG